MLICIASEPTQVHKTLMATEELWISLPTSLDSEAKLIEKVRSIVLDKKQIKIKLIKNKIYYPYVDILNIVEKKGDLIMPCQINIGDSCSATLYYDHKQKKFSIRIGLCAIE